MDSQIEKAMRAPIGKRFYIQPIYFPEFGILRVVIFFEDVGIVNVVYTILRWDELKIPNWNKVKEK